MAKKAKPTTSVRLVTKKSNTTLLACIALVFSALVAFFFYRFNQTQTSSPNNPPKQYIQRISEQICDIGIRVPGTPGHHEVQKFLVEQLPSCEIEHVSHVETTPIGQINFTNIIATIPSVDPNAKTIIIGAHYESKVIPNGPNGKVFVGATDSIVPCAMMLELAHYFKQKNLKYNLQFVFFDGEEAFGQWSPQDSLWGSKHLAELWAKQNKLENIHLFILLDLIAERGIEFSNFGIHFESGTDSHYQQLIKYEKELRRRKALKNSKTYFSNKMYPGMVEDDHLHFFRRKVPILHLIPVPFPSTWHTLNDDCEHIDWNSVEDIQSVLRLYLDNLIVK